MQNKNSSITLIRITALWALFESFVGGLLHALKVPMSGIVLAGFASICITMIALTSSHKGAIIKATFIVIAIKFLLSPQTPIMAYFAVLIEGIVGEFLFLKRKHIKVSAILIALFCLLYSAFQRILILVVLFGVNLWKAINTFLNKLTHIFHLHQVNYIKDITVLYIALHLIAGFLFGLLSIKIIKLFRSGHIPLYVMEAKKIPLEAIPLQRKNKPRHKKLYIFIALVCLVLLISSYTSLLDGIISFNHFLILIIRGALIVVIWSFLVTPLLKFLLKRYIDVHQVQDSSYFKQAISLFPDMKIIVQKSWLVSKNAPFSKRLQQFIISCILLTLEVEI